MAYKRLDPELRKLEKRANQRMVRLERAGMANSPAYQFAQGQLEMMGRKAKTAEGRRFAESGKETYNTAEQMKKILKKFLAMQTSTVKGTKQHANAVWNTADKRYGLSKYGVSKNDYFNFWANYPQHEKDRMFGSDVVIEIITTYYAKNEGADPESLLTGEQIAEAIQSAKDYKSALKAVGLSTADIDRFDSDADLGGLSEEFTEVEEGTVFDDKVKSKNKGRSRGSRRVRSRRV